MIDFVNSANNENIVQMYKAKCNSKWIKGYIIKFNGAYLIASIENAARIELNPDSVISNEGETDILAPVDPNTICRVVNESAYGDLSTGDIIDFYNLNYIGVVMFSNNSYWLNVKYKDGVNWLYRELDDELAFHDWKIIGNIYDNPSLI